MKHLVYNFCMFGKKFTKEPTEKQKIGQIGEDFACKYLEKNGYKVIERNYLKKWGEIDIVAKKGKKIHFIEVKSVSRDLNPNVIRETSIGSGDSYRPEDNMHPWKLQRLSRVIQSYLLDKDIPDDIDWQFDVVTVHIDMSNKTHNVFLLPDIVL